MATWAVDTHWLALELPKEKVGRLPVSTDRRPLVPRTSWLRSIRASTAATEATVLVAPPSITAMPAVMASWVDKEFAMSASSWSVSR